MANVFNAVKILHGMKLMVNIIDFAITPNANKSILR
jgi:hypothetical protein